MEAKSEGIYLYKAFKLLLKKTEMLKSSIFHFYVFNLGLSTSYPGPPGKELRIYYGATGQQNNDRRFAYLDDQVHQLNQNHVDLERKVREGKKLSQ